MKRQLIFLVILISLLATFFCTRPKTPDKDLFKAIGRNDVNGVIKALKRGADIEAKNEFKGRTPLIHAAQQGRIDIVRLLIEKWSNIHAKDNDGFTALMLATEDLTKFPTEIDDPYLNKTWDYVQVAVNDET